MHSWLRRTQYGWLSQVLTEVNNHVQSLLLNYHFALLRSGDFTYCNSIIKWGNSSTFATVQYVSYFVSIHSLHNNVDPQIPKSNGSGASANYTYHTGIASERSMWVKSQTWCRTRIFLHVATINLCCLTVCTLTQMMYACGYTRINALYTYDMRWTKYASIFAAIFSLHNNGPQIPKSNGNEKSANHAGFRLAYHSLLYHYTAWSSLAVSELHCSQCSAAMPLYAGFRLACRSPLCRCIVRTNHHQSDNEESGKLVWAAFISLSPSARHHSGLA